MNEEEKTSTIPENEALKSPKIIKSDNVKSDYDPLKFIAELLRTAIIVTILAYTIRLFIIQPFIVDGLSMNPVFHNNDYLLVDKISYKLDQPQRGDIIVFKYPKNTAVNYVKRIIGLPGEKVVIENGDVTIINKDNPNGIKLNEPYIRTQDTTFVSTFNNRENPRAEFAVPEGDYFVMGDNRQESSDSREWGFLSKEKIIGRVFIQAFPVGRFSWVTHARY